MSSLLFDKVALITGASRGVGYAAARKLCEKFPGATIYLATKNQNITPELRRTFLAPPNTASTSALTSPTKKAWKKSEIL